MICRSPPQLLTRSPWAAHVALRRVNLYANGGASCPLSAGARGGISSFLTADPSTPLSPFPLNSSLPSGDRGYHSEPVVSLCLFSSTRIYQSSLLTWRPSININRVSCYYSKIYTWMPFITGVTVDSSTKYKKCFTEEKKTETCWKAHSSSIS